MKKFKIGDRVKFIEDAIGDEFLWGKIGTVKGITKEFYAVEFDRFIGGHAGDDKIKLKDGHGWFCVSSDLEPFIAEYDESEDEETLTAIQNSESNHGDMQNKIEQIAMHYSFENQREIFVEECAEAIQAVQKCKRNNTSVDAFTNLVEEVADVLVTAQQMRLYLGSEMVDRIIKRKLDRQLKRMETENEKDVQDV